MARPTRTTNPLHFEDLSPGRFEDLAMNLVYRVKQWEDIHHDGRAGGDDGVDIRAIEKAVDGSLRRWFVQCKRYKLITPKEIRKAVDDALAKSPEPPDVLLFVLGCDVSLRARTAFEKQAFARGAGAAIVWTSSKLEAMLRADHPDLLFTFFGISMARHQRSVESDLRRTLTLKKKLKRLLPKSKYYPDIIVRAIDDTSYPDIEDPGEDQIHGWFKREFGGHDPKGIDLILRVENLIVDRETQAWAIVDHTDPEVRKADGEVDKIIDANRYEMVKTYEIGRIPFRNIFEADDENDDYYPGVHLYVRYADAGMPYEVIFQREIDGYRQFFKANQFKFSDRDSR